MEKITPFLWFDNRAEEAINFYVSVFRDAAVKQIRFYGEEGPGEKDRVQSATFQLMGREFYAIDGGREFRFTPAISFFVHCDSAAQVDELWGKLSPGGEVLMELKGYPFSEKYGWIQDRFGVSWQLDLLSAAQKIAPLLMFTGKQNGRAEQAMYFYASIFPDSSVVAINRYAAGEGGTEGSVKHGRFLLGEQSFMAMDSSLEHDFSFTPAISLFVNCDTQEEVDRYWQLLSAEGGDKGVCGWLQDRFGVSWQIVPKILGEMLGDPDPAKAKRVMQAMLTMQKLDIAILRSAYEGKL